AGAGRATLQGDPQLLHGFLPELPRDGGGYLGEDRRQLPGGPPGIPGRRAGLAGFRKGQRTRIVTPRPLAPIKLAAARPWEAALKVIKKGLDQHGGNSRRRQTLLRPSHNSPPTGALASSRAARSS